MKNIIIYLCALMFCTLICNLQPCFAQEGNNLIGLRIGSVLGEKDGLWYAGHWFDREASLVGSWQYYHKIAGSFFVGIYTEYEILKLKNYDETGSRYGIGINFMGRIFGENAGVELGGKIGIGFAKPAGTDADTYSGAEHSIFLGPFFKVSPSFQLAFHVEPFVGWYGDEPTLGYLQPRVLLQMYYCF